MRYISIFLIYQNPSHLDGTAKSYQKPKIMIRYMRWNDLLEEFEYKEVLR